MVRKKKILYIHHGKGLGGAPLSLLYLIEYLNKDLYDPVVLFLHDSQAMALYKLRKISVLGPVNCMDFPHSKIRWFRFYHPHLMLKSIIGSFKIVSSIAQYWFDKIKPDVVHLNTSSLTSWASVAKKNNIPVVFHVREPLADGYFGCRKRIITKLVSKHSNVIMPICLNDAKPWKGNKKVQVVYNAVDPKIFDKDIDIQVFLKTYNLSFYDPKILFLGGLSLEKGTLEMLRIFKKLLNILPQAKLVIAGYFDLSLHKGFNIKRLFPVQRYKKKVMKVLQSLGRSVIFLGPTKKIPEAMAACDVVVVPSTVGHFARPIIEAGFMQKPVIASHLKPLDELVINTQTGFLLDIKNHEKWVEKLHTLLINKKFNQKIGERAFEFCNTHFNVCDQVKKVETVYGKLLMDTKE
jgi:glycosyltransferase involved in cell wall biosynthesis